MATVHRGQLAIMTCLINLWSTESMAGAQASSKPLAYRNVEFLSLAALAFALLPWKQLQWKLE